jgi:CRISPR-associated exonuclease Cas4
MPYTEDQLLPISALEHLLFCERQCALIHIEQTWADNALTAQGTVLHTRTHEAGAESRGDLRIARSLRLRSLRLGLSGMADVVEWQRVPDAASGVALVGAAGRWQPYPVEYKRGKVRPERSYEVQLCAQALCLEEMLGIAVPVGAIYGGASHQRREVAFDQVLRTQTEQAAARMHTLFAAGVTPPAAYSAKCRACSLADLCLPRLAERTPARQYLDTALAGTTPPEEESSAP